MRDQRQKHLVAVRPTTFMGRLPDLLGKDACARLQAEAEKGEFGNLRERALYVSIGASGVQSPAMVITFDRARELLLLALEAADEALVGYTNYSVQGAGEFSALMDRIGHLYLVKPQARLTKSSVKSQNMEPTKSESPWTLSASSVPDGQSVPGHEV